jgi:Nitrogen regulatory protein P-II
MRRIQANCWSQAVTDASATGEERYGGSEYAATDLIEKKKLEIVCVRCARLSMEVTLAAYTADCRGQFIGHLLHMHVTTQTMCSTRQSLSARPAHGPMDSAFGIAHGPWRVGHGGCSRHKGPRCRSQVDTICRCIAVSAYTGEIGDGKIFVSPVADIIRMCAFCVSPLATIFCLPYSCSGSLAVPRCTLL